MLLRGETIDSSAPVDADPRTVRDYLAILAEELPGVVTEGLSPKRYRYSPSSVGRDRDAFAALALARHTLVDLRGSALDDALVDLLESRLVANPVGDLGRRFYARTSTISIPRVDPNTIDVFVRATLDCRRVVGGYSSFRGNERTVVIEPWSMIFSDLGWHVYGRCHDSSYDDDIDRCRLLALSRFDSPRLSDDGFVYPALDEYDPGHLFRHAFGMFLSGDEPEVVELLVDPRWKHFFANQRWHPTQETSDGPGRALRVVLRVGISEDFVRFLRSLGPEVEVVTPERLAALIQPAR